jgi:hypothetical protein
VTDILRARSFRLFQLTQQRHGVKIDKDSVQNFLKDVLMVDDRDFEAGRLLIESRLTVYGSGEDGDKT